MWRGHSVVNLFSSCQSEGKQLLKKSKPSLLVSTSIGGVFSGKLISESRLVSLIFT